MPIHLNRNPYAGINAHWNSLLQSPNGGWESFHALHLAHLSEFINDSLPPGYYASMEKALVAYSPYDEYLGTTRPDISVLSPIGTLPGQSAENNPDPNYVLDISFEEPPEGTGYIQVYDLDHQIIARLELLSPSNKKAPESYLPIRNRTRATGAHLIELDYLHRWPNLFESRIPDYSQGNEGAYPYSISLFNVYETQAKIYGVQLGAPLPALHLPLRWGEFFRLDFEAVYHYTFSKDRRAHIVLDYSLPPLQMETYSPDDQAKILALMAILAPTE